MKLDINTQQKVASQMLGLKRCTNRYFEDLDPIAYEIVLDILVNSFHGRALTVKELLADSSWSSGAVHKHLKKLLSMNYVLVEKRQSDKRFSFLVPAPKLLRKFDSFALCATDYLRR